MSIDTIKYSPGHSFHDLILLQLVHLLTRIRRPLAIAIDDDNVVMKGNNVLMVLGLLDHKFVRVIKTANRPDFEIKTLRLATSTLRTGTILEA